MPGQHSDKQKRQAEHITQSEKSLGASSEEAKKIAWATVIKQQKGESKSGKK